MQCHSFWISIKFAFKSERYIKTCILINCNVVIDKGRQILCFLFSRVQVLENLHQNLLPLNQPNQRKNPRLQSIHTAILMTMMRTLNLHLNPRLITESNPPLKMLHVMVEISYSLGKEQIHSEPWYFIFVVATFPWRFICHLARISYVLFNEKKKQV